MLTKGETISLALTFSKYFYIFRKLFVNFMRKFVTK